MDQYTGDLSNQELDDLISDVRSLLGEEQPAPQTKEQPEEVSDVPQSSEVRAEDIIIDYQKFYGKEEDLEKAFSQLPHQENEEENPFDLEKPMKEDRDGFSPQDDADYSEWLYRQGEQPKEAQRETLYNYAPQEPEEEQSERPKKKGSFGKTLLTILGILLALAAVVQFVIVRQPKADSGLGLRKSGISTILVAGTDESGARTDTMMLISFDRSAKSVSLVSVPRDTLVYCEYSVPKINSAYGWAGGGEDGMEELCSQLQAVIGFRPDGYVVVSLDTFEKLVDLMGGITFNVPQDMNYEDPTQGLSIHLTAGEQELNGNEAMQLARFRSGYADADLGRISVQRDLVQTALGQWSKPANLFRLPAALMLLKTGSTTNLSVGNYLWLAESALVCKKDNVTMSTLPGYATYIAGGSYYVLDASSVVELVNTCLNPYEQEVTAAELSIRVG